MRLVCRGEYAAAQSTNEWFRHVLESVSWRLRRSRRHRLAGQAARPLRINERAQDGLARLQSRLRRRRSDSDRIRCDGGTRR
jgi:hypothetical protein